MVETSIFRVQTDPDARHHLAMCLGTEAAAACAPTGCDAVIVAEGGAGRCAIWSGEHGDAPPQLDGRRSGFIGRFQAVDRCAAAAILESALDVLRAAGCAVAVGPLDGSTWNSYRFMTQRGTEPPFFLEPDQPPEWPEWWAAAGFRPLASYTSVLVEDLARHDARLETVRLRLHKAGVRWRSFDVTRFDGEMTEIHRLCLAAFRDNFLYTPIAREAFLALYEPIRGLIDPRFVQLAFDAGGGLCGFLFAIPDRLEAARGRPVRTLILKTVATRAGRAYAGLGNVLVANAHDAALKAGFARAIHALMHDQNDSLNLSRRYGSMMRKYALFYRPTHP